MSHNMHKAFTLIELLVVIAIIGILAGFIIVSMSGASDAANDTRRKADINQLAKAVMIWKTNNPDTLFPVDIDGCNIGDDCTDIFGSASVLRDPNGSYYTYTSADGTDFTITAELSNTNSYSFDSSTGRYSEVSSNPINGICGTANKVFYATSSDYGDSNFCNVGTLSSTPVFPEIGQTVNWTCIGADGGTTASCSATRSASSCIDVAGLDCNEYTVGTDTVNVYTLTGSSTTSTTWTVPAGVTEVEYLVVAGGGSGGFGFNGGSSGGGGAGGLVTNYGLEKLSVSENNIITVGRGGAGGTGTPQNGNNGDDSVFGTIVAVGGGGGGRGNSINSGSNGGSGGGGPGGPNGLPATYLGGLKTVGQGNNGGNGYDTPTFSGGGGGGAGEVGGNGATSFGGVSGKGGNGSSNSITGLAVVYAGGGGGGSDYYNNYRCSAGAGGNGGGGAGGGLATNGVSGTPNTGSGGGGSSRSGYEGNIVPTGAGAGGSGIVVVRFKTP
ncbi:MAG: hypothetical protein BWY21_01217 [Parcubacteria group bacterium ADurb.Bin216]|nr:MAG: hypothetical protein BWY21_01217 [Parcubacteria group bacterium ADurb.Bin216]